MFELFLAILVAVSIGMWMLAISSALTSNKSSKNGSGVMVKFLCNSIVTLILLGIATAIMLLLKVSGIEVAL